MLKANYYRPLTNLFKIIKTPAIIILVKEFGILGVTQKDFDLAIFPRGFVDLRRRRDRTEILYDEMHEMGQGLLAEEIKKIGKVYIDVTAFDKGICDMWDLAPYSVQTKHVSSTLVENVVGMISKNSRIGENGVTLQLPWFYKIRGNLVDEFQSEKTKHMKPDRKSQYIFGSDCMGFALTISEMNYAKRHKRQVRSSRSVLKIPS